MAEDSAAPSATEPSAPPFQAVHFDTPTQQYQAAKLGMWIFLLTEILLFGGLFCAYAVYRSNHPEIFVYGSIFLDRGWGAINTVVLLFSSFTMALAVRAATLRRRGATVFFLSMTLLLACDFLGIKWIEYRHKFHENLVWGHRFYEDPHGGGVVVAATADTVERGRKLFLQTCAACHGPDAMGAAIRGKKLPTSRFIATRTDQELVDFIKRGRTPDDPLNTTGLTMLPKGGNPALTDRDLFTIVQYLRSLQEGVEIEPGPLPGETVAVGDDIVRVPEAAAGGAEPEGTEGTEVAGAPIDPRRDPNRPRNVHLFFAIYFLMTGLHGVHVLAGMVVICWLLRRAARGDFATGYFTPVEIGGLYWHLVDLIWIYLFPLFYLIH